MARKHRQHSVTQFAAHLKQEDNSARAAAGMPMVGAVKTFDSFENLQANLGIGANNLTAGSTYGFNPITRNRTLCEWIHRGSWVGGAAIDIPADDMTKAGVTIAGTIAPADAAKIQKVITELDFWAKLGDVIRWARMYGGALGVYLIKGQDMATPLRIDTVGVGQYFGIYPLDRWMVDPSLNDIVQDFGPNMGLPKYYRVNSMAPALSGQRIHHSRVIRLEGVHLPYQQAMTENLWGISVFERLYDRMVAFDSATTGAAQLVFKAYLRTYKIKDLRSLVAAGGDALGGLTNYINFMSRYQSIEGVTLMDDTDTFEAQTHGAFGGLSEAMNAFAQQLCGALETPMTRFLGLSPGGLGSNGEGEMKTYHDGINQKQKRHLGTGVHTAYRLAAKSEGIAIKDDFLTEFVHLYQISENENAEIASKNTSTVVSAESGGLVTRKTALLALKKSGGIWDVIPDSEIEDAEDEIAPTPEDVQVAEIEAGDKPGDGVPQDEKLGAGVPTKKTGDSDFKEDEHPRASDGRFGSGGGSGKATKAKTPAAPLVARVEGAPVPPHIHALKLPPAWTDVRYSPDPEANLQATGKDSKGRAQYVYSRKFMDTQAAKKFTRISCLVNDAATIKGQLAEGRKSSTPKVKAHADCADLIMQLGIRPGSDEDTQAKVKAYGATTLLGSHVVEEGDGVVLKFTGKKGVALAIPVTSPDLVSMLQARAKRAGTDGKLFPEINSASLLGYVHSSLDHGKYKTKDFRTLLGTSTATDLVAAGTPPTTEKEYRTAVMAVAKQVSAKLGNTPTVALQSYIAPQVFAAWRETANVINSSGKRKAEQ